LVLGACGCTEFQAELHFHELQQRQIVKTLELQAETFPGTNLDETLQKRSAQDHPKRVLAISPELHSGARKLVEEFAATSLRAWSWKALSPSPRSWEIGRRGKECFAPCIFSWCSALVAWCGVRAAV
jgi:hypothetical protein